MIGGWTNIFKSNDLELYYYDFEICRLIECTERVANAICFYGMA